MRKRGYFDPLAYLRSIRNVRKGLETRSKIIKVLRKGNSSTKEIAKIIGMSYSTVRRQLRNMEKDKIVIKISQKWKLTGKGQKMLDEYIPNQKALEANPHP